MAGLRLLAGAQTYSAYAMRFYVMFNNSIHAEQLAAWWLMMKSINAVSCFVLNF